VISADGPDAASVTDFTLRTSDGRTIDFKVGPLDLTGGGLPAPHLREHMLGGTPTTVYYRINPNGEYDVVKYTDAGANQ
jgi:hypothetical protein